MAQVGVHAVTLAEAVWLTLCRAVIVATAAAALAYPVQRYIQTAPAGRHRSGAIVAAMVTLLAPGMLAGYAYGNFALSLLASPWLNEAAYAGLLSLKLLPWAVGAMVLAPPPPVSQSAMHLLWLMKGRGSMPLQSQRHGTQDSRPGGMPLALQGHAARSLSWIRCSMLFRGPLRNVLLAWAVVFVLTFSDFELASLLAAASWTVWLFDAQVGGLPTAMTLAWAAGPLLIQLGVLAVALALLLRGARWTGVAAHNAAPRNWVKPATWSVLGATLLIVLIVPAGLVLRQALPGAATLAADVSIAAELLHSLLLAGAAAAVTLALVQWVAHRKLSLLLALCAPGMLGALALALVLQWAGQQAVMNWAYDTPLLLMLALVFLLLPPGVALWLGVERREPATSLHLASLLASSAHAPQRRAAADLRWALLGRGRWLIAFALFLWAYFELLASAMLAPTGMMTAPARLYNLMHYGHSAVLSAMLALTIVLPLAVLAAATAARHALRRLA